MPPSIRSRFRGAGSGALSLSALMLLASALSGCTSALVGAGAVAGTTAMQERGFGTAVDDTVIDANVNLRYLDADLPFQNIRIAVHEGRVLLTGTVPKPEDRVEAVRLAWLVGGVREVINELEITDQSGLMDLARDKWITARLRVRITFDASISAINYTLDCVNGTVFLMGIAQSTNELERVRAHARDIAHVRRIVSHVRIKAPDVIAAAAGPVR